MDSSTAINGSANFNQSTVVNKITLADVVNSDAANVVNPTGSVEATATLTATTATNDFNGSRNGGPKVTEATAIGPPLLCVGRP